MCVCVLLEDSDCIWGRERGGGRERVAAAAARQATGCCRLFAADKEGDKGREEWGGRRGW